jgi:RNA polymerase sigma-70 factor (ECF subfamily)
MLEGLELSLRADERLLADAVDDDALARAAQHDATAFATLYHRYLPRVYRYVLARLGDTHEAQDVTAQTFLAALEGIASYRGRQQFAAWLLTIARHKSADHCRRRAATMSLEHAADVVEPGPSLEQVVAGRLRMARVIQALQTLTPERAEALALRLFGGLSLAESARVMGKNEAAVKMLVHRGLRDLQARLAGEGETG